VCLSECNDEVWTVRSAWPTGGGGSLALQNTNKIIFVVSVSVSAFCRTF